MLRKNDVSRHTGECMHPAVLPATKETLLRAVVETISDLVWLKNANGVYLACNAAFGRLYGASEEEIVGKTDYDFVDEKLADFFGEKDRIAMAEGKPRINEEWLTFADDGHQELMETVKTPMFDDSGAIIGVIGVARDITARKRMAEELAHANEKLNEQKEDLTAMNEEMTAMNEELNAMNEALEDANRTLVAEVDKRQKKEQEVLRREKQYQATTNLIKNSAVSIHDLLEIILNEAITLVGAPGGYIGLLDESGGKSVMRHTAGANRAFQMTERYTDVGLLGEVCRSGELQYVEDYYQYPNRIDRKHLIENLRTVIMMPLKQDEQVKGVLVANWQNEVHPVTTEDIEIFQQFGNLASIAMERLYAGEKIANQNLLLQKLAESTAALVNDLDMDKVLQNILNQAVSFMGVPNGFIQLYDSDGDQANFKSCVGRYVALNGTCLRFDGKGILSEIRRTGKSVIIDDYTQWPQRMETGFVGDITAAMQAPLILDGKTIGSIGLTIFDEPLIFDREKLAVFDQFATVAAIAVKNAMTHSQMYHQAFHDGLTGLPNRDHLIKRLNVEMNRARKGESAGAVLFIDLDDLKTVNDHFGHTSGDDVIVAAGKDIVRSVGDGAFVARVGGDEFVVILSGVTDLRLISDVANQVVGELRREFDVEGQSIQMTSSVGVTLYPEDGDLTEEILKNADVAMYAAKNSGKNRWCFYESQISGESYTRMVLTNSLRRALERKELSLCFQAQVSCGKRRISGFEALLRWNSPEHGAVPPARFIPLAEQSGLIHQIGHYVLVHACRFVQRLKSSNFPDLRVAVNISPRQLAEENFVESVNLCILNAGIEASQLELEVTENVFIESMEDSIQKLLALKELGVHLALDDFGTGYSSMTYLRHLPVDTLKIDKAFIDPILIDESQERFVHFIIEMAHSLNLQVVAEGVEDNLQVAKLERLGCDIIQGYVYSHPVPEEVALQLLGDLSGELFSCID